ncbi:MAG TPA: quinol:electron acceptor oxidoreductase subunit ActD, partial [Hyphomicrobiales bacterium]|nr:quinol:electron acceptor oxidoreductase subunit ActD [Hyphomicrobiales bacterium]
MRKFVATFQSPEALLKGIRKVKGEGFSATDAITPFRLEEIESLLDVKKPPIRAIMAAAGFLAAGFAYWLEWFSAVIDYPINSGGRP